MRVLWHGKEVGDLDEDTPLEMARRMLDTNEEEAIRDVVDFYMDDYKDQVRAFFEAVISGTFSHVDTYHYLANMIDTLYEDHRSGNGWFKLFDYHMEMIE